MKEAGQGMSALAFVVAAVVVIAFFFFRVLWPKMQSNNIKNTKCAEAVCAKKPTSDDGLVECYYKSPNNTLRCPYKG